MKDSQKQLINLTDSLPVVLTVELSFELIIQ